MISLLELLKKRVFVVAEIGCNHNGNMEIARDLIISASKAGADAVKFQTFNPVDMITINAPKANYQIRATGNRESQFRRLHRLKLTRDNHEELKGLCERNNIIFCSSPFDHQSVNLLNELDVPFFKVGSGEVTNLPLLEYMASFGKPIILSTGMSSLGEIEEAIYVVSKKNRDNIILMHCLSDYPARWEDVNLRAIQTLSHAFHLPVGFSDHTEGTELSLVAVGIGAVIIEKHITLSREMEGGDHLASLEPHEFKDLVDKIRKLEMALGDGIKKCMPSEEDVKKIARKSIVARKNIKKGSVISNDDLAVKRPGTGIQPRFLKRIIGRRSKDDISADQLIAWSQIDIMN
jgi:N,N'-diacetyllegionaminate synthase